MNKNDLDVMFSSAKIGTGKDYWETPLKFYNNLNNLFNFTLDPAASHDNHKCNRYFTQEDDGLKQSWKNETIFVNPPYSQNKLWIKKCAQESKHSDIVLLIPARVDTKYFQEDIFPNATAICFIKGRLKFEIDGKPILDKKGNPMGAPFPSSLCIFTKNNALSSEKKEYLMNLGFTIIL